MQEKENIMRILKEAVKAVKIKSSNKLISLSNQTIHTATIYCDPDNIMVAVLVYSLGKIFERENYMRKEGWNFFHKSAIKNLDLAIKYLRKDDLENFRLSLGEIRKSINEIKGDLREYIQDVFYKAGLNKAFKMYEHGISSEKTAEILGVSLWDLSSYIGQGKVHESKFEEILNFRDRVKFMENFLK